MDKTKKVSLVFMGIQWLLIVIIGIIIYDQIQNGFDFNYFMIVPFLLVVIYKIWQIRFDRAARMKLEKVNKDFHGLGRNGRRKYLYSKGIKKPMKRHGK